MAEIILMDGGTGQELVARSSRPATPLWSAEVMEHEPELVRAIQQDFIDAGATVITVNSYAATVERLSLQMDRVAAQARFEALQAQAVRIALAARANADQPVSIAGCLPPLVASFHPEAAPTFEACLASYNQIVALQAPSCEVMLIETMALIHEARAAVRACVGQGARAWVALTVDDDDGMRLRSGEALAAGVEAVLEEGAEAVLLNCSRPEAISDGLAILRDAGVPFGAYANGFVNAAELDVGASVEGMGIRSDLGPKAYAAHAMDWVRRGATLVGGCCEVGPGHIAELKRQLVAEGHTIVGAGASRPLPTAE